MKSEMAAFVLAGTAGSGALAWLSALWGYCRAKRPGYGESYAVGPHGQPRLMLSRSMLAGAPGEDLLAGLSRVFGSASGRYNNVSFTVKRESTSAISVFNTARPSFVSVPAFSCCCAEVRAVDSGGSEIMLQADCTGVYEHTFRIARMLLAVGLVGLLGASALLWLVAPHLQRSAGLVQLLQCFLCLVLAAPWVLYALHRRICRATGIFLDSAIVNATTLAAAFAAKRKRSSA